MCETSERNASRRVLQLSIRASMAVVVVLSCLFAWVVCGTSAQRAAVARIWRSGGSVYYGSEMQPAKPDPEDGFTAKLGLRRLLPGRYLEGVTCVVFKRNATDGDLASVGQLPGLEVLVIRNSSISDAGLRHLSALRNLRHLELDGTQITDDGLVHLETLTGLRWLNIAQTKVTEAGLRHVTGLSRLERLRLPNSVSENGVYSLRCALPNASIHRTNEFVYRHLKPERHAPH